MCWFKKHYLLLSCVLYVSLLFACGTSGNIRYYFYKGAPKPREEVSLIVMQRSLYPVDLVDASSRSTLWPYSAENPSPMKMPYTFDVAPGDYILQVIYFHNGVAIGNSIYFPLHAQAGKIYYLYSKMLSGGTWQLLMRPFATEADFVEFMSSLPDRQESGSVIVKRIKGHFQAEETHSVFGD